MHAIGPYLLFKSLILYICMYSYNFYFVVHPFIIKDTFTQCLTVIAPDSFTISVEFVGVCMDFNITWLLNGNLITDDFNHEIVISDLSKSRYRTSVKIMQSSERDFGNYTVTIMAATGSDSANINVKIIGKLQFVYDISTGHGSYIC